MLWWMIPLLYVAMAYFTWYLLKRYSDDDGRFFKDDGGVAVFWPCLLILGTLLSIIRLFTKPVTIIEQKALEQKSRKKTKKLSEEKVKAQDGALSISG